MSVSNAIQNGNFDLNLISLRKPLEFADGTIQDTAYIGGSGIPTLEEVLISGDDAQGLDILGVGTLQVDTQIQLTPTGDTVNFQGEINQVALGVSFNGNQLQPTHITSNAGQSTTSALEVVDDGGTNGLFFIPNSTNNAYNPICNAGDATIIGSSATVAMAIGTHSGTTNGININTSQMVMGFGGTGDIPTQNITFNNPANTIKATTTTGFYASSSTIEPNPTLAVQDVPTGQAIYFVPKGNASNYNPISQTNNQQIVAWGSAGINTQTLELTPWSSTSCGIRLAPTTALIGAGGTGANPTNYTQYDSTGTLEYGNHQFVNGLAQYSAIGQYGAVIPSAPSASSTVPPAFEVLNVQLTGASGNRSGTLTLQHNLSNTTNYAVFPSIYYGYGGSGGTFNAIQTTVALSQIVIQNITSTQFEWNITQTNTSDNINIFLVFLIVYNMTGTTYPKSY